MPLFVSQSGSLRVATSHWNRVVLKHGLSLEAGLQGWLTCSMQRAANYNKNGSNGNGRCQRSDDQRV